jgi:hypothetical protein
MRNVKGKTRYIYLDEKIGKHKEKGVVACSTVLGVTSATEERWGGGQLKAGEGRGFNRSAMCLLLLSACVCALICGARYPQHLFTASCSWMLRVTMKGWRAGWAGGGGGMMDGRSVQPRELGRCVKRDV